MNHKFLEDWVSYVSGVFGFGVFWTNVHWDEALPKIFVASASAFAAGFIGYLGKLVAVWSLHKIKTFFRNIKKKQIMATIITSKQWRLNVYDFGKALLVAAITPVVPIIAQSMSAKAWVFDWTTIWHTAAAAGFAYLVKNFFTPSQTISTPARILILILGISLLAPGAHAQSPFRPIPKVVTVQASPFLRAAVSLPDSSLNAWRIVTVAACYAEPGNILMAGIGYGYQHLNWDYTNQKWVCQWSVSPAAFAGGSVAPSTPASIMSVGILGGIDNNLVMAGPIYNFGTKQFGVGVSIGINFNN